MNKMTAANYQDSHPLDLATVISAEENGRPLHYRELNQVIRNAISQGKRRIILESVMGQRYIASGSKVKDLYIEVKGTPGNNLGAFLDGPTIEVFGNAQDMTGNTMNSGRIIIHGNAWDVTGLAARGGRILVLGSSGYRVGIHMKAFENAKPSIIIGGRAGDYLGEYMAGGSILILGRGVDEGKSPIGSNVGAGIHGGKIFIFGQVSKHQLGPGATLGNVGKEDVEEITDLINDFESCFGVRVSKDWDKYAKVTPLSSRPFRGHFDSTSI
jgi:glutamate synthase domain-containing protein 3